MTRASIIVPAYNCAATLRATVTSLLAQTLTDYEIILVDDGSHDDTAALVQELAGHDRIRAIRQANRGLAGARNTGIAPVSAIAPPLRPRLPTCAPQTPACRREVIPAHLMV